VEVELGIVVVGRGGVDCGLIEAGVRIEIVLENFKLLQEFPFSELRNSRLSITTRFGWFAALSCFLNGGYFLKSL
jgi:hypothetical protein